jgi:hypothetical protein
MNYGKGDRVTLKAGYGYWDTTSYPLGGKFGRAPACGLPLTIRDVGNVGKGCNAYGKTDDGRSIAFHTDHTEGNAPGTPTGGPGSRACSGM